MKKSQRKGRNAEFEFMRLLEEKGFPAKVGDPLNYGTQPDVSGLPGVHIEVKRCEKLKINDWYDQAVRDSEKFKDGVPVVFFRQNRKPWMCFMAFDDFVTFL